MCSFARSRAKHHNTSLPSPLIKKQYSVFRMRALIRLTTLFFLCAVKDSQYNKTLMNHLTKDDLIKNGYRIKSPIRSVIIGVINKIGRPRSKSPICQSRDDAKSCY